MATVLRRSTTGSWSVPLTCMGASITALLLIFWRDAADMMALWWNISTYQHCLYVLPIIGWLLWLRHRELAVLQPAAWLPGLGFVFGGGLLWLIGEAGGVALFRHVGLIVMIQSCVVTILGPAVTRAVLFPLFYLIFLVPFGDEFTGPMQTLTAKMTMALLAVTGVPATIDGVFITTRAGWFEVAEACAGVKFLVAMVAYGALAANVCFRSVKRRTLFMAAAIVVPVLANGARAWATIYAAEWIGVARATGFDHIVYGWIFFAVVMIVIMGAAWPFFDRKIGDTWLSEKDFRVRKSSVSNPIVVLCVVATAALMPLWDTLASAAGRFPLSGDVALPRVDRWARTGDVPATPWRPRFDGADHILLGRYGDARGRRVDVGVALYGWQGRGREIVGFGQGAVDPSSHWAWAANLPSMEGGRVERIMGPDKVLREAATFWSVGTSPASSKATVKLATLTARLTGADQSAATFIISAEGNDAQASIAAFLADMGDPQRRLAAMMKQAKGR